MSRLFKLMLMGFGALFLLICLVGVIVAIIAIASPAIGNYIQASHMEPVPFQYAEPDFAGAAGAVTGARWGFSFFSILAVVAFSALIYALLFILIRSGMKNNKSGAMNEQETRLMQEIHQGLTRMEERVESLETLLLTSRNG